MVLAIHAANRFQGLQTSSCDEAPGTLDVTGLRLNPLAIDFALVDGYLTSWCPKPG
jgi:hypothetical protein